MSNLLQSLIISINKNAEDCNVSERNKFLEVSLKTTKSQMSKYEEIIGIMANVPVRDQLEIVVSDSIDDEIRLNNNQIVEKEQFESYFCDKEKNDLLDVKIIINKKIEDDILSVYNFEAFCNYLLSLNEIELIKCIEDDIKRNEKLIFEVFDKEVFLTTKTILFRSVNNNGQKEKYDRENRIIECRKNSNIFWESDDLPIPDDFHFIAAYSENPFREIFERIESLLSILYISDNVRFSKDYKSIYCQVIGQRMNEYKIDLSDIFFNSVLYDIYSWIYTEGNIVDKISLSRNLLSMHCRNIPLYKIDSRTFGSIKVNFSLYQKENVDKYISLKNEMTKFIAESVNQYRDIVFKTVEDLGKNIIAFFSFMLTIFASNLISGKGLSNIFSKDVTYISYVVIAGSLIFMVICYLLSNFNLRKINESYNLIKENNNFFKESKEYDEIFDDDKLIERELEAKQYRKLVFVLWGTLLLILFIVVEFLGDSTISEAIIESLKSLVKNVKQLF